MAVYVRVELWPGGDRTKARLLQEAMIANVGGDGTRGDYAVKVSHSTTYKGAGFADPIRPTDAEVWRTGRIANHARNLSPFHLVCKAVGAAIGLATEARVKLGDDGSTVERKRRAEPALPVSERIPAPLPAWTTPTPTPAVTEPIQAAERCPYCSKRMPAPAERTAARIRENREWRNMIFCSPTCAAHYQMGAEG